MAFKDKHFHSSRLFLGVSILVFLEVAFKGFPILSPVFSEIQFQSLFFWKWLLKPLNQSLRYGNNTVSILVFLEVAFKDGKLSMYNFTVSSFNPCFSGSGF